MTAGSCSIAISRSRPPRRALQDINRGRSVHRSCPVPGARTALRLFALGTCGQQWREDRGLGRLAPVRDHALAPAGAWGRYHGQIRRFVSGRGVSAAKRSNNSSGSNKPASYRHLCGARQCAGLWRRAADRAARQPRQRLFGPLSVRLDGPASVCPGSRGHPARSAPRPARGLLPASPPRHRVRPGIVWVQTDGELLGELPMTFECVPAALSVVVPG
jgi:hypothetical protein